MNNGARSQQETPAQGAIKEEKNMARTKLGPRTLAMALALVCSGMAVAQEEETEGSSGFFSVR